MFARMASGLLLALGFADLAVLNLVLTPRLTQGDAAWRARETAAQVSSAAATVATCAAAAVSQAPPPAAPPPAPPASAAPVPATPDVVFPLGEIRVTSQSAIIDVRRVAQQLSVVPGKRQLVRGHSDRLGSPTTNRMLSWQRAESVTRLLAMDGAPLDRIAIEAAGSAEPADADDTPVGWARNRRVQLLWR